MKLVVGVRTPGGPGEKTLDILGSPDFQMPMWEATKSVTSWTMPWEEIEAFHVLEHVPADKIAPSLRAFYNALGPGGVLTVTVPDLTEACRLIREGTGEDREQAMGSIYGSQEDAGQYHRWGFTHSSLREALVAAGFEAPQIHHTWSTGRACLECKAVRG